LPTSNEQILAAYDRLLASKQFNPFVQGQADRDHQHVQWDIIGDVERNWLYVIATNTLDGRRVAAVTHNPGGWSLKSQLFGIDAETNAIAGALADQIIAQHGKELTAVTKIRWHDRVNNKNKNQQRFDSREAARRRRQEPKTKIRLSGNANGIEYRIGAAHPITHRRPATLGTAHCAALELLLNFAGPDLRQEFRFDEGEFGRRLYRKDGLYVLWDLLLCWVRTRRPGQPAMVSYFAKVEVMSYKGKRVILVQFSDLMAPVLVTFLHQEAPK
jgi:hypothetical protein